MTSSIISKASVSLRDRAKFWRRYEAVQSIGRRVGIFSRLQLSYSRCKARKSRQNSHTQKATPTINQLDSRTTPDQRGKQLTKTARVEMRQSHHKVTTS